MQGSVPGGMGVPGGSEVVAPLAVTVGGSENGTVRQLARGLVVGGHAGEGPLYRSWVGSSAQRSVCPG